MRQTELKIGHFEDWPISATTLLLVRDGGGQGVFLTHRRAIVKKPKKTITRRSPVAVLARRRPGAGSHRIAACAAMPAFAGAARGRGERLVSRPYKGPSGASSSTGGARGSGDRPWLTWASPARSARHVAASSASSRRGTWRRARTAVRCSCASDAHGVGCVRGRSSTRGSSGRGLPSVRRARGRMGPRTRRGAVRRAHRRAPRSRSVTSSKKR